MSSFLDCAGLTLDGDQLRCPMFTIAQDTNIYWQYVIVICSFLCSVTSFFFGFLRHPSRKRSWLIWNIMLWQMTNTWILSYLLYTDIDRLALRIYGLHTFLEWLVSITMEMYATGGSYRCNFWRLLRITVVVIYSVGHEAQLFFDQELMRVAWVGLFGYILDGVGLFSSIAFAIKMYPSPLGFYCVGAFGGHALAILGSLIGCMIHPEVNRAMLFGWSMIQNISSTLAIRHLSSFRKPKTD